MSEDVDTPGVAVRLDGNGAVVTVNETKLSAAVVLRSLELLHEAGVGPTTLWVLFDFTTVDDFDDDISDLHRMAVGAQTLVNVGQATKVALVSEPGAGEHFVKLYRDVRDTLTPRVPATLPLLRGFTSMNDAVDWTRSTDS